MNSAVLVIHCVLVVAPCIALQAASAIACAISSISQPISSPAYTTRDARHVAYRVGTRLAHVTRGLSGLFPEAERSGRKTKKDESGTELNESEARVWSIALLQLRSASPSGPELGPDGLISSPNLQSRTQPRPDLPYPEPSSTVPPPPMPIGAFVLMKKQI